MEVLDFLFLAKNETQNSLVNKYITDISQYIYG